MEVLEDWVTIQVTSWSPGKLDWVARLSRPHQCNSSQRRPTLPGICVGVPTLSELPSYREGASHTAWPRGWADRSH